MSSVNKATALAVNISESGLYSINTVYVQRKVNYVRRPGASRLIANISIEGSLMESKTYFDEY